MGLVERRAAADFQERVYPGLLKRIRDAAGFPVVVEVQWDQLSIERESEQYAKCWPDVYFEPLIAALGRIAKDSLGEAALKGGLKKIVVQNDNNNKRPDTWATMKDGVLTLDHIPFHIHDRPLRADNLQRLLEQKL